MAIHEQINRHHRRRRTAHKSRTLLERTRSLQPIPENDLKTYHAEFSPPSSPTSVSANLLQAPPVPKMQLSSTCTETLALVNQERARRHLKPFRQSMSLNQLAAQHATAMCQSGTVFHSVASIEELMFMLQTTAVAENIQRGDCVAQMHRETMHHKYSINQSNLLSPYFSEFGSAVAMGRDGKLYSCQLFRG